MSSNKKDAPNGIRNFGKSCNDVRSPSGRTASADGEVFGAVCDYILEICLETWRQMSDGALRGAEVLLREGHYRSSVSRAYYSAYCAAANEIVKKVSTFSFGWNNPAHPKVPVYVQSNLTIPQN